jgi:15-cis-phytoene synthase
MTGQAALPSLSLPEAYAAAEQLVRQRSQTFRRATLLLSRERRRAMWTAYAFFRQMDDMADRAHASPDEFHRWREQALRPAAAQSDPILLAWADVRERYGVDERYVRELLDGIEMDLARRHFETLEELYGYCHNVASTVGLMAAPILGLRRGVSFEQAMPYAEKLGIALQITNILRDVAEDLDQGLIYLPRAELAAVGLTFADIESRVCDQRFRNLMARLIALNRQLYAEAWPGVRLLAWQGRLGLSLGATAYRALLDEIELHDYDVFTHRPHVGRWRLVGVLMRGLTGSL